MTTVRHTAHSDGTSTITHHGTTSSDDYQSKGVTVRDGNGSRTVITDDQLRGDEIIHIGGMELRVQQARELGLMSKAFADEGLSMGAAVQAAQERKEEQEPTMRSDTGHAAYDQVADSINESLEAGNISVSEAHTYNTAMATVAMADLDFIETMGIMDGLADGSISELDLEANQIQVARGVEKQVTDAATKSAMSELGPESFNRLSQLAAASPLVQTALRNFTAMRAMGNAGATWCKFLQDAEDELAGRV